MHQRLLSRRGVRVDKYCVDKRSEEHTSELQSHVNIVCRLLLEKIKSKERHKGICGDLTGMHQINGHAHDYPIGASLYQVYSTRVLTSKSIMSLDVVIDSRTGD